MAGLLDGLLLDPDDDENEEGSVDDDSDLEVVEVDEGDPQQEQEPAELGDLLMVVAEPEIEHAPALAAEGAEGRQPCTVAEIVQCVAERRADPKKKTRNAWLPG